MSKEAFKKQYHVVFDDEGNIKACGRENCKKLIHLAKSFSTEFGNEDTGMMNPNAIKDLYQKLFPKDDNYY